MDWLSLYSHQKVKIIQASKMMEETIRSETSTDGAQQELFMDEGKKANKGQAKIDKNTKKIETLSVDFDSILPHVGEMGIYQMGLFLLMCIPACLPAAFLAFNQVFLSASPDHWCKVSELNQYNLTADQVKNLSIPFDDEIKEYQKCQQYDVNFTEIYELNGHLPALPDPDWNLTSCKEGWIYDRREYKDSLVTEVSPQAVFEKSSKCPIWNYSILSFSINFCTIKIDMSGNIVWPQASSFQNSPIFGIFIELLSTQNVNRARFARNVVCDFLADFQTLWNHPWQPRRPPLF